MSLGAMLVALACLVVVVAYVTQPLRQPDWEDTVEVWIALERAMGEGAAPAGGAEPVAVPDAGEATPPVAEPARFCPQCGSPVAPDHRFCPACGHKLPEEAA